MTYRTIIVDDEEYAREIIKSLISADPDLVLVAECKNGKEAIAQIVNQKPDIVFLDIQMPEVNGFDVIAQTKDDHSPHYIFATAYDEFALKAFEVNAIDYLLKPFDDHRFYSALNRAKSLSDQHSPGFTEKLLTFLESNRSESSQFLKKIALRIGRKIHFIPTKDIDWIEADNQYVKIHAWQKEHIHRESLKHFEEVLDPRVFCRIHRSSIVNVHRIETLEPHFKGDYTVTLKDGTKLKLSKKRKDLLQKRMGW